jgi:hypothetical protein
MRLPSSSATKRSAEQKAESIRSQGVLSPLLVRPLTDQSFEIVAGARRYRAAQIAEAHTVPVRIVNLSDAEALAAQLIEISINDARGRGLGHHTKYLLAMRFRQIQPKQWCPAVRTGPCCPKPRFK